MPRIKFAIEEPEISWEGKDVLHWLNKNRDEYGEEPSNGNENGNIKRDPEKSVNVKQQFNPSRNTRRLSDSPSSKHRS